MCKKDTDVNMIKNGRYQVILSESLQMTPKKFSRIFLCSNLHISQDPSFKITEQLKIWRSPSSFRNQRIPELSLI